ncbi:MAG: surface antigen [Flaviaesturariibacter sp.]|nr:surface antigen [Flaviaesturariibacter sp.]
MGNRKQGFFSFLLVMVLAACSTTKHLPPGEKLYTGGTVSLTNAPGLSVRERKTLKSDLNGLTRPRPNTRFLGLPIKLGFYNLFRNKKPNTFFGKFRDQFGEPPVLLSSVDISSNIKLLENHLQNKGFFNAKVTGDTIPKGKKGKAEYKADAGAQYTINSIRFPSDSILVGQRIAESSKNSLLAVNKPYDLDVIKGERLRIDADLKEKGFFYFSPDYILVQVDSTVGNNKVDMVVKVKPETPDKALDAYRINDVFIYTNYNINAQRLDTSLANDQFYEGYHVIDRRKRFKPKMFPRIMVFKPGDLYNRTDHNITLGRLINLNEFKYVKNRFEPVTDSAKLDAYYYLTPLPKKSLRAEVNLTSKSNNLNGTELSFSFRNRNTFRQAEQLSISAYVGSEIQFAGTFQGYNTYRTGAEATFAIPRFVVPFFKVNTTSAYVPRSNIQLGYDILNRQKLYTLNSFRANLGYSWKPSTTKQFEFNPISITYVQPLNVTKEYSDSVFNHPYLKRIIDSQFVIGSTFQYNYNEQANGLQKINSFYFNGLVDLSGNIAGLLTGANATAGKEKRIFNALFDQYIKLEVDGRYYRRIGLKSAWANRVIVGYGRPYGNSRQMPYIKQFSVGGNNSLRGFRSRSVGPGTFFDTTATTFLADQTGDLKLELNTEFRPHISGPLYGAVFVDAGNIWLAHEDPLRPGSKFTNKFFSQLAVDAGVGIRLDIVLFVIRLDVAFPLRKPWEVPSGVTNQIDFNDRRWRRENIVYNLAIGYPF